MRFYEEDFEYHQHTIPFNAVYASIVLKGMARPEETEWFRKLKKSFNVAEMAILKERKRRDERKRKA